jgi:GPH family glycoside/pentoside/hexuronide:cation symporter
MLNVSGFDVELTVQPEETLFLLRVFDVGVPLATSALAILIMLAYPINEEKAYEIRAELERRRGKLGADVTPA